MNYFLKIKQFWQGRKKNKNTSSILSEIHDWKECDVLLTCISYKKIIKLHFKKSNVIYFNSLSDLLNILPTIRVKRLGLICNSFSSYIDQMSHSELNLLLRACSFSLTYLSLERDYQERKILHKAGFYQLYRVSVMGANELTIGCTNEGEFVLYNDQPGIDFTGRNYHSPKTLKATRLTEITNDKLKEFTWKNQFLIPYYKKEHGFCANKGMFALAVTTLNLHESSFTESKYYFEADFSWLINTNEDIAADHASLVASYDGPEDTNMQLVMLQIINEKIIISLWTNTGSWVLNAHYNIPNNEILTETNSNYNNIKIWLRIGKHLEYGYNNIKLGESNITVKTNTIGIRTSGDSLGIQNMRYFSE